MIFPSCVDPDDKEKVLLYMGLAEKELARLAEIAHKLTLTAFASDHHSELGRT
jgi:hypothetical protein